MPRVYRGMLQAEDGLPALGPGGRTLGVRTPDDVGPEGKPDITPDPTGVVRPHTGGMSVAPRLVDLPDHRIPKRLRLAGVPRARGQDALRVWAAGEGAFDDGASVAPDLVLRIDPGDPAHGLVEPDKMMHVRDYLAAIESTRDRWVVDEVIP